ncbi:hypothetical protein [Lacinutrix mariniflava]|uniref:hypothetical protein n=1 Tax=Lacinutrix mariniflava TaxID=342955 RepID=UPI0006E17016|nr:hypothetical protein [Lacinutrix mariniflava]
MKNYKLILLVTVISFLNFSCLVDDTEDTSFGESPYVVGFTTNLDAVSYFEDEGIVGRDFRIELLGGMQSVPAGQDITINYEIDPASTATEGQEFDFTDNSGAVTINAGDLTTNFSLNINTGSFDTSVRTELILNLISTTDGNSTVGSNVNKLSISFVGCVSNASDFQYSVVTTREDTGDVFVLGIETVYFESVNNFRTTSSGSLAVGGNGAPVDESGIDFSVLCGDINIPTQGLLQGLFAGNLVEQVEATSIDANGDFELKYSADYGGATGVINFTGVYTKL